MSNPEELIEKTIAKIEPPCAETAAKAQKRIGVTGSAEGAAERLDKMACRIAAAKGSLEFSLNPKSFYFFAGKHGIAFQRADRHPSDAAQEIQEILSDSPPLAAELKKIGIEPVIVDFGLGIEIPSDNPRILDRRIGPGTRSFVERPAMRSGEAARAIAAGIQIAESAAERNDGIVAVAQLGENAEIAACSIAALWSSLPVEKVTGLCGGLDEEALYRKRHLAGKPMFYYDLSPREPMKVVETICGFEMAGIIGLALGCAARKIPLLLDGYAAAASALVAKEMAPDCAGFLFLSSIGEDPGHRAIARELSSAPVIDPPEETAAAKALCALDKTCAAFSK